MTMNTFRNLIGLVLTIGLLCLMYVIYGESIR